MYWKVGRLSIRGFARSRSWYVGGHKLRDPSRPPFVCRGPKNRHQSSNCPSTPPYILTSYPSIGEGSMWSRSSNIPIRRRVLTLSSSLGACKHSDLQCGAVGSCLHIYPSLFPNFSFYFIFCVCVFQPICYTRCFFFCSRHFFSRDRL